MASADGHCRIIMYHRTVHLKYSPLCSYYQQYVIWSHKISITCNRKCNKWYIWSSNCLIFICLSFLWHLHIIWGWFSMNLLISMSMKAHYIILWALIPEISCTFCHFNSKFHQLISGFLIKDTSIPELYPT